MSDIEVRIEQVAPMRVASFHAFSPHPERDAWQQLEAWAGPRGYLEDTQRYPIYGFNNPNPTPGQDAYGYEFWLRLPAGAPTDDDVEIKSFAGGLYAVTTIRGVPSPDSWARLVDWVRDSRYGYRYATELERAHNPLVAEADLVFDLYLPVAVREQTAQPA